jgi:hypothetical protein
MRKLGQIDLTFNPTQTQHKELTSQARHCTIKPVFFSGLTQAFHPQESLVPICRAGQ